MSKFSKAGTGSKPKGKSRWAGVQSKSDRTPMINVGKYVAKHMGATVRNESGEWCVVTFEVVTSQGDEAHQPGDEVVMLQGLGDRYNIGAGKVKAYVMALIGCPNDDAYDEFDPEGEFLDAVLGEENDRSGEAKELIGTEIEFTVRRGKDDGKGGYYREFSWVTNPEE